MEKQKDGNNRNSANCFRFAEVIRERRLNLSGLSGKSI